MNSPDYRMNGGLGFAIDELNANVEFTPSKYMKLVDLRRKPFESKEQKRLFELMIEEQNRYGFKHSIEVKITGLMVGHSGFGSGTAITLACLEAIHIVNDHSVKKEALIKSSKRGGTSGVGIHTYFSGGFVFDLGRPVDSSIHMPSHEINSPISTPLLLSQLPMPDWEIGICVPRNIAPKTQENEREFFRKVCPISSDSVYEATYHSLFGLFGAIKESNKPVFCSALKAIQKCTWKRLEREEYGKSLENIESALYFNGAEAVGMSSLGPGLFFLADDINSVIARVEKQKFDCDLLLARPINSGREVSV
jgi:beta-ribofuranosylaminobenzene 5'-phosphate synthase